jgi:hypothetical protein
VKKTVILLGLTISVALILSITMLSCKSPTAAEAGKADSTAAEAVTSAAARTDNACINCHSSRGLVMTRNVQRSTSLHSSSSTFQGNAAECAICHSSEGFTERIAAGKFEISADIKNPSPIGCRTCHQIHKTFTSSDWALTTNTPVVLQLAGDTFDWGKGNLCANCHQAWPIDIPKAGGGDYEITSTSFGPHHGPQAEMTAGVGGYGDKYTGSNVHYEAIADGCVTCHMTDNSYGKESGGHTMSMSFGDTGSSEDYVAACIECHKDIETFDRDGVQTEVESRLEELRVLLVAQGLIDEAGTGIVGTFTSEQAGALWNYRIVAEDKSFGVHNPGFTKFLLQTAIDALNKK